MVKGAKAIFRPTKVTISLPYVYIQRLREDAAIVGISGFIREALEEKWGIRERDAYDYPTTWGIDRDPPGMDDSELT